MRGLGIILLAILALVVSPVGATLAVAGPGAMVLCIDGGAVKVALDASGQPVEPGEHPDPIRHCPDCLPLPQPALAAVGGVPSAAKLFSFDMMWTDRETARAVPLAVFIPAARGPPGGAPIKVS